MAESATQPEQDNSDENKVATEAQDADDVLDSEPPAELHAGCKQDCQLARTKAQREKQRRAQLKAKCVLSCCCVSCAGSALGECVHPTRVPVSSTDGHDVPGACRYTELSALIEPNMPPRADRGWLPDAAVQIIKQLRVENDQLRQMNKLMEERVKEKEAPYRQALHQAILMSQGALQPPARVDGASTSTLANVPGKLCKRSINQPMRISDHLSQFIMTHIQTHCNVQY